MSNGKVQLDGPSKPLITFVLFLFLLTQTICGHLRVDEKVVTQKISSLEEPTWVFKTGMSRGKYHDRQDLGMVLEAGATIKIRKFSINDGYTTLTFRLLGNNEESEKSVELSENWQTIKIQASGVPFIDTPYGRDGAEIQYEVEGPTTKLPIFSGDSNQTIFLNEWDESNASFSLIKGHKFQLLLPVADKATAKKMPDFDSLDDLVVYIDSIITNYDNLMGLSSTEGINKTPTNRFFIKADGSASEGVAAYYSNNYIANGFSILSDLIPKWGWCMLHEIGHAYQPFYNNKEMETDEVSNNLLALLFLYEHRSASPDKQVENALYEALIDQHKSYEGLGDYFQQLVLLTNLALSAGKDSWTKFNIAYREAVNTDGDTRIENMSLPDLLTWFYSSLTKRDYSPVFNQWGLSLTSTRQPTINRANEYPAMASLVDVVPKERLSDAVTMLSPRLIVNSNFTLVTNQDIEALKLPGGALALYIVIDDFDQIKGKVLQVKNGPQVVQNVTIVSPDIIVPALKNGIYTLSFPETETFYTISNYYGYVRDEHNDVKVEFKPIRGSKLFDETILFRGLASEIFGSLTTDFEQQQMFFNIFTTTPHPKFQNETYATLEVHDESGKRVYENTIKGNDVKVVNKKLIPLKEGYEIKIYHAEAKADNRHPERLTASTEGLIDNTSLTNTLIVKNGYLINKIGTPGINTLVDKINTAINELKQDPALCEIKHSPEKNDIILAILSLPEKERTQLFEEHQVFLALRLGKILSLYNKTNKEWFCHCHRSQSPASAIHEQFTPMPRYTSITFYYS